MSYSQQLTKPQWQKKRLECFERAGWKCQKCGCATRSLHLHHPKYIKGRKPWEYDDLVVLCSKCHKGHHFPPVSEFEYGEFYRVISGQFSGITAVAWDHCAEWGLGYRRHTLFSWDFPGDGVISFSGCPKRCRRATKGEELHFRRKFGMPPTE
jgi:hypothetical protein